MMNDLKHILNFMACPVSQTRNSKLMICLPVAQISYDLSNSEWNTMVMKEYYGGYVQMFLTLKNEFINGMLMKKVLIWDSVTVFN